MKKIILPLVILFLIGIALACPADPTPFTVEQPDGTEIEVRQIGDERGAHIETLEGYTVLQDSTGHWVYAELENNQLISTFELAATYASPSIEKHLQTNFESLGTELEGKSTSICELGCKQLSSEIDSPLRAPQNGTKQILVFLINFTDTTQDGAHTPAYYENLLFNTSNSASFWAYYNETSYGLLNVTGTIVGNKWYQSSYNLSHYGANNNSCGGSSIDSGESGAKVCIFNLTIEAMTLADGDIDYSAYDLDADNILELDEIHILVIHAGGAEESGGANNIWSHKWIMYGAGYSDNGTNFGDVYLDSVRITRNTTGPSDVGVYAMVGESSPVGIVSHEYGHVLGMPDLYNTGTGTTVIGDWDIMDHGGWNNGGNTPAHFSAWSKYFFGWISPIILTEGTLNASLTQVETNNTNVYMLLNDTSGSDWTSSGTGTGEFFLIENRQQIGFDANIPSNGLLIWHINESASNNNNVPRLVDLESNDGTLTAGAPWKDNATGFTPTSNPNSLLYDGSSSKVHITNISASGTVMNMTLSFGNTAPNASNVAVIPAGATTSDNLTCNYTYSDIDGDSESGSLIKWFVDSTENTTLENSTTVNSGNTTKSEVWMCSVTPSDGTDYGSNINSSNLTIQNAVPTVTLTAPNGAETWNTTHNITWSASDADSDNITVDLYYTYNGTWMTIATNQNDTSYYEWNVTDLPVNSNYTVNITINDSTNTSDDVSDAVFTIGNAPVVLVTSPNGGETVNTTITVTANVTDADGQSAIETVWFYYSNTSSDWTLIGNSTTPVGSEYNISWNTSAVSDGTTYKIKVNATDNTSLTDSDTSNANFIVNNVNEAPSITLTEPDAGDNWSGTNNIEWTATDPDGDTLTIDIRYSSNGGSSWNNLSTGETNDGSYSWDTTDYGDDTDYQINVTATDPGGLFDSDASGDFEIDNSGDDTTTDSGSGSLDSTTDTSWTSKTFDLLEPGKAATWSVPSSSGLALTSVELTTKETLGDVTVKSKKLSSKPGSISVTPAGKIHQYFQMSTTNLPAISISSITFKFKIPKSWFTSNNADEDSVALRRWSGNGWTKLTTTKYDSDSTSNYYSAPSSGFSYFVITAASSGGVTEIGEKSPGAEEASPFAALGTGAAAKSIEEFLSGTTFGLDNSYWVVIFAANVFMFIFLIIGVKSQQKLKPRPPRSASRWRRRFRRPPSYGRAYTERTQQIKPTAYFSPLRRGRRR